MSLHYLVKYLRLNNHSAQEIIEENCHGRLSHRKTFKIFVWQNIHYLIHYQKNVHTSHIKNPIIDCTQLL